jgi:hypothetical protein
MAVRLSELLKITMTKKMTNLSCLTRQMHSDGKMRRSFLAMLFTAGDLRR